MKKEFLKIVWLISVSLVSSLSAQSVPDSVYYQRLYYTGKLWGYVKYFHTRIADGAVNWDTVLINALPELQSASGDADFNLVLMTMLESAGSMDTPQSPRPDVPAHLKYNLDLSWMQSPVFSAEVRAALDTIKTRFRPREHILLDRAYTDGNPTFESDMQYYEWGVDLYPDQQRRVLALFRYWNIINYFFPYKNLLDQDWDRTLRAFIPKFIESSEAFGYHNTFLELAAKINDAHGVSNSSVISEIKGRYYLPFELMYINNKTVIVKALIPNPDYSPGDIIKSIDGIDVDTLRNHVRKYTEGSNPASLERNINNRLRRSGPGTVKLVIENNVGEKEISISRVDSETFFDQLRRNDEPVWKTLPTNGCSFGYVDMGRLEREDIPKMFELLWDTDGIIFDIRNYPRSTMWSMINYLFDIPIKNALFTVPDIAYPGTLYWKSSTVGFGDFSRTYDKPVMLLFNELTQSQAEYTVMALEQHPQAIKIGSQTAGADGNISWIYLPGGIVSNFTGLGAFYPDSTETQRIGIIPDIEVLPTIEGIRAGRDEVLEVALQQCSISLSDLYVEPVLYQNYPNPVNPSTTISYVLPEAGFVTLKMYNLLGQEVRILVNASQSEDRYTIQFEAGELASGIYFYALKVGNRIIEWKKMMIIQ